MGNEVCKEEQKKVNNINFWGREGEKKDFSKEEVVRVIFINISIVFQKEIMFWVINI